MNRLVRTLLLCLFVLTPIPLLLCETRAQDLPDDLDRRLTMLDPSLPRGYFELGEDVADLADSPAQVELARRLFVLAAVLADEAGENAWIRPSACLALAQLEPTERRERWLRALATSLDPRYRRASGRAAGTPAHDAILRLRLAEFLGLARAGLGNLARDRLDTPGVQAIAERVRDVGARGIAPLSFSRHEAEARIWPCPECSNARIIPDPSNPSRDRVFCSTCRGDPGPDLSQGELVGSLALEAVVLDADARTWSAATALGLTDPVDDPELEQLPAILGIDPSLTVYVDGRWQRP
ncbi:MAG: hypothetical protein AAGB48_10700 [Planctomycetota bacterium]